MDIQTTLISQSLLDNAFSYPQYITLLETLLNEGKTTGINQSEGMLNYAKLNLHRLRRVEKTVSITNDALIEAVKNYPPSYWLIITEGWCGDAAQLTPLFKKLADINPAIELKVILRDEHLDIMDNYLTNGGRAIPKIICLDKETLSEKWNWGPRPQILQDLIQDWKAQGISKDNYVELIHKWYTQDKLITTQTEILDLLR